MLALTAGRTMLQLTAGRATGGRFAAPIVVANARHADMVEDQLAGVEAAVMSVPEKAILYARTGAAAVDMESHVAAAYAARHALPFAAIRVVCDPAERSLPAFAAEALKPNGEPDIIAVLGAVARRPAHLPALIRLARDSGRAFKALTRTRVLLGAGLGVPDR